MYIKYIVQYNYETLTQFPNLPGLFWFCNQKPTCNFICSEDEGYLFETGIMAFERTNQPQPKCCGNNLAKLRMVKDMMKQNYGRPFFVCSKDADRCSYFEWADEIILSKPPCYHNEPCVSWTVKKEGSNKGKRFFCCSRKQDDGRCKFFKWATEKEEEEEDVYEEEADAANKKNTPPTKKTEKRLTRKSKKKQHRKATTPPVLYKTDTVVIIFYPRTLSYS